MADGVMAIIPDSGSRADTFPEVPLAIWVRYTCTDTSSTCLLSPISIIYTP